MSADDIIRAYLGRQISRREFTERLRNLGVTAGAAIAYGELLAGCTWTPDGSGNMVVDMPRALSPSEFNTVQAIAGRVVPTTDTPGAIEAGAVDYIDFALAEPYRAQLARYQRGTAQLDTHCRESFGKAFADLAPEQQDEVLEGLEGGKIAGVADGPQFFELVRRHTMEGFFCEPYYGGNRDLVGWKLVNFPGQRYGYPDPYINRVIDLPPVATNRPPRKEA
jgi:gluconate 2-dehydrogenase gamma chain